MNVTLAYRGHSEVDQTGGRQVFRLVPNLSRDPVGLDAPLRRPLRFREAMSALHDIVVSDLRFKKRDRTAFQQWKNAEGSRAIAVRRNAYQSALQEMQRQGGVVTPELEARFTSQQKRYWAARLQYSNYLYRHDPALWRQLLPCDPVITVADDVAFFECFSADESSYGCLTVNRDDGFGPAEAVRFGTTNVDYSWQLYHHFQSLRSYRETRFQIDPEGFSVATAGSDAADIREEKIDLPDGWLRGFLLIQAAMTLPTTRVQVPRDAVYAMLAFYKRHRARTSPRAIRFEFVPGRPVSIVLEPWEQRIETRGAIYDGPPIEPIRVWGGRRLLVLARTLPLAERFDVELLGTGLPSFWIAVMGEMRLTLGLSGWTANDWTRGSSIDLFAPPAAPSPDLIANVAAVLHERRAATLAQVAQSVGTAPATVAAALRHLAHSGQVIHDLAGAVYRWRQVMPMVLGEAEIGPEHPELTGARTIMASGRADLESRLEAPRGGYVLGGTVDGTPVEIIVDADGAIKRGKCLCSHYHRFGMRNGPCRHMLALSWRSSAKALEAFRASSWYNQLREGQD